VTSCFPDAVPSIYRWQLNIDQFGTVTPPSAIRGRVRVITRVVLTAMENLYQDQSDLYLDEVLIWLAFHHDIYISKSTLQRTLTEAGLTRKVLQKIASERNEDLRQQFRDAIIDPNLFAGASGKSGLDI
jgi:transposase